MRRLSQMNVLVWVMLAAAALSASRLAQASHRHPRKYKSPPAMAHVEVTVLKASTGKPLYNAAVVFHPIKQDKDEGDLYFLGWRWEAWASRDADSAAAASITHTRTFI